MHEQKFRNRVSQSLASLPITALLVSMVWMLPDVSNLYLWGGLGVMAAMTLIVAEWNNQFQLIRIRSRMNSVVFLTLMALFPNLHVLNWAVVPAAALLVSYFVLFRAYGAYQVQGIVFHAMFFISLGSLSYPPLLLFVPFLLISAYAQLRALTLRAFFGGLLGVLLPYWLYAPYLVWQPEAGQEFFALWKDYLIVDIPDYAALPPHHWVAPGLLVFLALVSLLHFLRTAYNDKIRTRQYFYLLLVQFLPLLLIMAAYPTDDAHWIPLLIVNMTPFVGHYFTLARGRLMNLWFWCWLVLLVALGGIQYLDLWRFFYNI